MKSMKLSVSAFRAAGLEARWSHNRNGAPIIEVRNPHAAHRFQRDIWWTVTAAMWEAMRRDGILQGFNNVTVLGDIFSVPA